MASVPKFVLEEVFPEAHADALSEVLAAEKEVRAATARRLVAVMKASTERVLPDLFENRMLANRSFRAQIAALLAITEKAAENLIGYAGVLTKSFPNTLQALAEARISWQHAVVIVDELAGVEETSRQVIEGQALEAAPQVTPNRLGRIVRLARESRNPESIPQRHEAARRLRGVGVEDGRDGMSTMFYTDKSVLVHAAMDRITKGAKAMGGPLEERTLNQRKADLLGHVLLAEIDGEVFGVVPDEWDDTNYTRWFRGITPEVIISVPVLTLLGKSEEPATLNGWIPIDPDTARVLAGRAKSFIRILTHPEDGAILSIGRKRYKVPKDMQTVLRIRDLTCRFPGCEIAAQQSDIDHQHEWQHGGETKISNLGHLCRGHHTLKGNTTWSVTESDGGVMTWTDPTGRTYTTQPHNPMAA